MIIKCLVGVACYTTNKKVLYKVSEDKNLDEKTSVTTFCRLDTMG